MNMIEAGYMSKRIAPRPDWIKAPLVDDVFSVSSCVSEDFCDYINFWKHNGYWLFNSPDAINTLASEHSIDLSDTRLFYYEIYGYQFNERDHEWVKIEPEPSFTTAVVKPAKKSLQGYDVVTFYAQTSPECSPLSCNSLAEEIETNRHCLLGSFEKAKKLVEDGLFNDAEPGPYQIFAVFTID